MKQNVKHECDSSTLPLPPVFIVHHADQLVQLFSHIPWNRWLVRTNYSWFSSITFQSDVDKRVKCTCSIRQQAHKLEDGDGVEHLGKWTRTVHQYLPWPAMWSPDLDLPPPRHPLPPPRPSRCFFSGGPEHHSYSFYKPVCRTIIGPWLSHKTPFKWKRIELNWKFGENVLKNNGHSPCCAGSGSVPGFPTGDCQIGPWSNKGCPLMTACLKQATVLLLGWY